MHQKSAFALVAAVAVVGGCGSTDSGSSGKTVTVIEKTVAQPSAPAPNAKSAADDGAEKPTDASGSNPGGSGSSGCIRVPNVVGRDHQLAQDTMQSKGLYALHEVDATGQGRLLLYDRNWTTVRQKPAGGACVSEDTTITLYAKKDGE